MSETTNEDAPKKVELRGYVDERLFEMVKEDAFARHIPISEAVAQAVAKAYGVPDLAVVPRQIVGRRFGSKNKKKKKEKLP